MPMNFKTRYGIGSNSPEEVLNFAIECLKSINEKISKEDIELQDEFDKIYKTAFRKFTS